MILVTGGAGFIGSHIVQRLVEQGEQVRVIDNLTSGKLSNICSYMDQIEFIEADIRDEASLRKALSGVEIVFHLAAEVSVPSSIGNPVLCHEINTDVSFRLLHGASQLGVQRVVLSSSSAVYGSLLEDLKTESLPYNLQSPYASSKAEMEINAQMFYNVYGLETVCLRYFNVYGLRQSPFSPYAAVIPKFMDAISRGNSPTIFGDGEQTRDFIYISDVVQANLLAAQSPKAVGENINIATGKSCSLNELVKIINSLYDCDINPVYATARIGDIRHSKADVNKAKEILQFDAKVSINEGLMNLKKYIDESS